MRKVALRGPLAPALLALVLTLALTPRIAGSHCQIPCGIYDDSARIDRLYEDAQTIEKAMRAIEDLAGKTDPESQNQLVRWVVNKEEHATNIMTIVAEYFLAQRVKPAAEGEMGRDDYLRKLEDHHRVMLAAMKAKQEVGLQYVESLREAIETMARYYLSLEERHEH